MATLNAVRQAIADRLNAIGGLTAYAYAPGNPVLPAAVVAPAPGTFLNYVQTMDGIDDYTIGVSLFVAKTDEETAHAALDAYLDATGPDSILAAVAGDPTLGGTVHFAEVTEARNYGEATVAGTSVLACDLVIAVRAT